MNPTLDEAINHANKQLNESVHLGAILTWQTHLNDLLKMRAERLRKTNRMGEIPLGEAQARLLAWAMQDSGMPMADGTYNVANVRTLIQQLAMALGYGQ